MAERLAPIRVGLLALSAVWLSSAASGGLASGQGGATPAAAAGLAATRIALPAVTGGHAIWGATGQDARGHIWFGIAAADTPTPSAHLIEYDPAARVMTDRGNVIAELARLKLLRQPIEHQAKIHSKIVEGPDGYLYFASMDEEGESESRLRLPVWGGHLWRMRLTTGRWEHLAATPEALIAVARGGRFIYALGYFGHVLNQYDTKSGALTNLRVGSADAHISRNLLADDRGHVYVPRLSVRPGTAKPRTIDVSLVEFDGDLREVAATRLETSTYLAGDDATGSHGIIALQPMADRSIYFTTHLGYLYRVAPPAAAAGRPNEAPAAVTAIGWFNPDGPMYVPSLFTPDGTTTLFGMARHPTRGYEWVQCAVPVAGPCRVRPLVGSGIDTANINRSLLYGSATRDAGGGHYVVGITPTPERKSEPLVLRIVPDR